MKPDEGPGFGRKAMESLDRQVRFLFPLPAIIIAALLFVYPMFELLLISMSRWKLVTQEPRTFIWFANFTRALFHDTQFWKSVWYMLYFAFGSVFLQFIFGFTLATGCTHEFTEDAPYKEKKPNSVLNELFVNNAKTLGREMFPRPDMVPRGSTDLGNLSHAVPTIVTFLEICGLEVPNHPKELAEAAIKEPAWEMIEDAARIMAFMAVDVMSDPRLEERIKQAFLEM